MHLLSVAASRAVVVVLAVALLSAPASPAAAASYPVVLIPGLGGGLPEMAPLQARLQAEGYDVRYFSEFDGIQSYEWTARRTAYRVKKLAARSGKVNLVCFSGGVLSCRYAMKYLGISKLVPRIVLVGGGDGNFVLCALPKYLGGDGCATDRFSIKAILGDDTPGPAEYYFVTSFPPPVTAIPDGGVCYEHIPAEGFVHGEEPFQPVYQDWVATAMAGSCPGEFYDLRISNFY